MVDTEDLPGADGLGLDVQHPPCGLLECAAASDVGDDVATGHAPREHHDIGGRYHSAERGAGKLLLPGHAERLMSKELCEPGPPGPAGPRRKGRHMQGGGLAPLA